MYRVPGALRAQWPQMPGNSTGFHAMAVDSRGNVHTAEVDTGQRIQKFRLTSDALR
jgi:hypothetical protein